MELIPSEPNQTRSTMQPPESKKGVNGASTTRTARAPPKSHGRTNSYASSTRPASTAPRTAHGSFSSSVGPGSRPASSIGMTRPQTSFAAQRRNPVTPRPASSIDVHDEELGGSVLGKRKGTQQSLFSPRGPFFPVGRSFSSSHAGITGNPLRSPPCNGKNVKLDSSLPLDYKPNPLPSKIPITPVKQCKGPPQSARSRSPAKQDPTPNTPFLNKDSRTRVFNYSTGGTWDQDTREKTMEDMFSKFMSSMSQAGQESYGLKEAVELYKTRGK